MDDPAYYIDVFNTSVDNLISEITNPQQREPSTRQPAMQAMRDSVQANLRIMLRNRLALPYERLRAYMAVMVLNNDSIDHELMLGSFRKTMRYLNDPKRASVLDIVADRLRLDYFMLEDAFQLPELLYMACEPSDECAETCSRPWKKRRGLLSDPKAECWKIIYTYCLCQLAVELLSQSPFEFDARDVHKELVKMVSPAWNTSHAMSIGFALFLLDSYGNGGWPWLNGKRLWPTLKSVTDAAGESELDYIKDISGLTYYAVSARCVERLLDAPLDATGETDLTNACRIFLESGNDKTSYLRILGEDQNSNPKRTRTDDLLDLPVWLGKYRCPGYPCIIELTIQISQIATLKSNVCYAIEHVDKMFRCERLPRDVVVEAVERLFEGMYTFEMIFYDPDRPYCQALETALVPKLGDLALDVFFRKLGELADKVKQHGIFETPVVKSNVLLLIHQTLLRLLLNARHATTRRMPEIFATCVGMPTDWTPRQQLKWAQDYIEKPNPLSHNEIYDLLQPTFDSEEAAYYAEHQNMENSCMEHSPVVAESCQANPDQQSALLLTQDDDNNKSIDNSLKRKSPSDEVSPHELNVEAPVLGVRDSPDTCSLDDSQSAAKLLIEENPNGDSDQTNGDSHKFNPQSNEADSAASQEPENDVIVLGSSSSEIEEESVSEQASLTSEVKQEIADCEQRQIARWNERQEAGLSPSSSQKMHEEEKQLSPSGTSDEDDSDSAPNASRSWTTKSEDESTRESSAGGEVVAEAAGGEWDSAHERDEAGDETKSSVGDHSVKVDGSGNAPQKDAEIVYDADDSQEDAGTEEEDDRRKEHVERQRLASLQAIQSNGDNLQILEAQAIPLNPLEKAADKVDDPGYEPEGILDVEAVPRDTVAVTEPRVTDGYEPEPEEGSQCATEDEEVSEAIPTEDEDENRRLHEGLKSTNIPVVPFVQRARSDLEADADDEQTAGDEVGSELSEHEESGVVRLQAEARSHADRTLTSLADFAVAAQMEHETQQNSLLESAPDAEACKGSDDTPVPRTGLSVQPGMNIPEREGMKQNSSNEDCREVHIGETTVNDGLAESENELSKDAMSEKFTESVGASSSRRYTSEGLSTSDRSGEEVGVCTSPVASIMSSATKSISTHSVDEISSRLQSEIQDKGMDLRPIAEDLADGHKKYVADIDPDEREPSTEVECSENEKGTHESSQRDFGKSMAEDDPSDDKRSSQPSEAVEIFEKSPDAVTTIGESETKCSTESVAKSEDLTDTRDGKLVVDAASDSEEVPDEEDSLPGQSDDSGTDEAITASKLSGEDNGREDETIQQADSQHGEDTHVDCDSEQFEGTNHTASDQPHESFAINCETATATPFGSAAKANDVAFSPDMKFMSNNSYKGENVDSNGIAMGEALTTSVLPKEGQNSVDETVQEVDLKQVENSNCDDDAVSAKKETHSDFENERTLSPIKEVDDVRPPPEGNADETGSKEAPIEKENFKGDSGDCATEEGITMNPSPDEDKKSEDETVREANLNHVENDTNGRDSRPADRTILQSDRTPGISTSSSDGDIHGNTTEAEIAKIGEKSSDQGAIEPRPEHLEADSSSEKHGGKKREQNLGELSGDSVVEESDESEIESQAVHSSNIRSAVKSTRSRKQIAQKTVAAKKNVKEKIEPKRAKKAVVPVRRSARQRGMSEDEISETSSKRTTRSTVARKTRYVPRKATARSTSIENNSSKVDTPTNKGLSESNFTSKKPKKNGTPKKNSTGKSKPVESDAASVNSMPSTRSGRSTRASSLATAHNNEDRGTETDSTEVSTRRSLRSRVARETDDEDTVGDEGKTASKRKKPRVNSSRKPGKPPKPPKRKGGDSSVGSRYSLRSRG